jgi:pimeloyl-ACP methyl ester carboxylesterase
MRPERVQIGGDAFHLHARAGQPQMVLLHGLAGHGGEWAAVANELDAAIGLVCPDLRGHGDTWLLGTSSTVRSAFVEDVIGLIEMSDAPTVTLVGQSMGGIIATLVAHARPDLVTHLVLIEAGMGSMHEDDLSRLEAWFGHWPEVFADEAEASRFFGADAPSTPAWVAGLRRTAAGLERRFDPDELLRAMGSLATTDRWSEWSELVMPTTIVTASTSVLQDPEVTQMLTSGPATERIIIEDSGHDAHLDQPASVARVLAQLQ